LVIGPTSWPVHRICYSYFSFCFVVLFLITEFTDYLPLKTDY
jgi:hypothetical protein